MKFYDLTKAEREQFMQGCYDEFKEAIRHQEEQILQGYFADEDTYIRKAAYHTWSRLYFEDNIFHTPIITILTHFLYDNNEHVRQTAVYTLGEIGRDDFPAIEELLQVALDDHNKFVRNAIKGSLKRMGERNPRETFRFIKQYINHPNPEIRKEMIYGIELRGRFHPEEILPILEAVQEDPDRSVQSMLIHVLTQISYKQGCLEKVLYTLKSWSNQVLVAKALKKMIEVHRRYANFATHSPESAARLINQIFHEKRFSK